MNHIYSSKKRAFCRFAFLLLAFIAMPFIANAQAAWQDIQFDTPYNITGKVDFWESTTWNYFTYTPEEDCTIIITGENPISKYQASKLFFGTGLDSQTSSNPSITGEITPTVITSDGFCYEYTLTARTKYYCKFALTGARSDVVTFSLKGGESGGDDGPAEGDPFNIALTSDAAQYYLTNFTIQSAGAVAITSVNPDAEGTITLVNNSTAESYALSTVTVSVGEATFKATTAVKTAGTYTLNVPAGYFISLDTENNIVYPSNELNATVTVLPFDALSLITFNPAPGSVVTTFRNITYVANEGELTRVNSYLRVTITKPGGATKNCTVSSALGKISISNDDIGDGSGNVIPGDYTLTINEGMLALDGKLLPAFSIDYKVYATFEPEWTSYNDSEDALVSYTASVKNQSLEIVGDVADVTLNGVRDCFTAAVDAEGAVVFTLKTPTNVPGSYTIVVPAYFMKYVYSDYTFNAETSYSADATCGVETILIDKADSNGAIYNMQGQRVNATDTRTLAPGLYLINGQKHLIR